MKKYLILVKHSITAIVESLPAREWHLTEEGCMRAQRLAEQLNSFHPEVIASSTEPKARETGQIIADRYQLALHLVDGLQEHDRSTTPFLSTDQFQAAICEFFEKPATLVFGNETANAAHARFSDAVDTFLREYPAQTALVVSHGTVISLFVSRLTGISDKLLWSELGMPSYIVLDRQTRILIARENIL